MIILERARVSEYDCVVSCDLWFVIELKTFQQKKIYKLRHDEKFSHQHHERRCVKILCQHKSKIIILCSEKDYLSLMSINFKC